MAILRNHRGGSCRINEDERIQLATLLIKMGYTVRIGYRPVPGDSKGRKEYVVEYTEEQNESSKFTAVV